MKKTQLKLALKWDRGLGLCCLLELGAKGGLHGRLFLLQPTLMHNLLSVWICG